MLDKNDKKFIQDAVKGVMDQLKEMTAEMRVMRMELKGKADREELLLLEHRVAKLEGLVARN